MFDYMPFGRISIVDGKIDCKCHNYKTWASIRTVLHTGWLTFAQFVTFIITQSATVTGKTLLHTPPFSAPFTIGKKRFVGFLFLRSLSGCADYIVIFPLKEQSSEEVKTTFTKRHKCRIEGKQKTEKFRQNLCLKKARKMRCTIIISGLVFQLPR